MSRRMVRVAVSCDIVRHMVTNGRRVCAAIEVEGGLPEGAQFTHSAFDPSEGIAYLFYEHESFAPVPFGERVPLIFPRVTLVPRVVLVDEGH